MDYPEGIACPMTPKRLFIRLLTIGGGSFYLSIWSSKDLKWNRQGSQVESPGQRSAMAVGQLIFSSVLMFTFLVFLLFSCLNNLSQYSNWRLSSIGHGFDTPGSAPEPSSMSYLDPSSFCRIRHFGLKSWYIRMKRRRFLRRRLLYSANGTASFNPSLLENNLSGDIHPHPGPNSTSM